MEYDGMVEEGMIMCEPFYLNLIIKDSFLFTAIQFKSVEEIDAPVSMANMMPETSAGGRASDRPKETVRTYFPETWIWDLIPVG